MNCWENEVFWDELDKLIQQSDIVIDRPKGSAHPRYPALKYPLDYGYLKNTTASDSAEIDIWIDDSTRGRSDAVMCIIDLHKRNSGIKILYCCTQENMQQIHTIHNSEGMYGILIER